ncbi:hypothetical protein BO71DRAFT_450966 [Aspergillus ellipticus CBS 707.79]|uniref:Protein kinase domain-containing protein n=1 Tax=Aspergillus ellipticus CBS 707.79 TaxID=1448320 RepID=A0A319EQE6_9EURO|nr:hypothetical protein BO71DRAFT_450966 [Aspergillus ellipticus CBS 707.79]
MERLLRKRTSLQDLEDRIRIALVNAMQNKDIPSEKFAPRERLMTIWSQELLKEFIRLQKPGFREDSIHIIQRDFLQTISILCYIGWPEWSRFGKIFLEHFDGDGRMDRRDANIGKFELKHLEHHSFLGSPWAERFLSDQYIFCPIVLKEGESLSFSREWRLPFINTKSKRIRQGGYGDVTEETIPGAQYQSLYGLPYKKEIRIARKRFGLGQDFRFEVRNLKELRANHAHHDRILSYLATVTVGNDFNIISPLADMDLEAFLNGEYRKDSGVTTQHLIAEAANLADALSFLHRDLQSSESGYSACCHRDLKPANILIFYEGDSNPVGKWIITDFGISYFTKTEGSKTSIRQSLMPVPGPYQAPEACIGGESGRKSDVWSFGCILVRVLALGLEGFQGLKDLDNQRSMSADGKSSYDTDYFHRGVPAVLNPHVARWINGIPDEHDEYDKNFLLQCQETLLDTLAVDMVERLSARKVCKRLMNIKAIARPKYLNTFSEEITPTSSISALSEELNSSIDEDPRVSTSTGGTSTTPGLGKFLIQAIREENIEQMSALLRAKADAEEAYDEERPLIHAILTGNICVLEELFNHWPKLDLERPNSEGNTPLKLAVEVGKKEVVEILLHKGARIDAPSMSNVTPLMAAVRHANTMAPRGNAPADIIRLLKSRMETLDVPGPSNETPLLTLMKSYIPSDEVWRQKFNAILEEGADVNAKDIDGNTPLSHAIEENYVSVARKLLQRGAVYEYKTGHKSLPTDMRRLLKEFAVATTRRGSQDTSASSASFLPQLLRRITEI